MIREEIQTELPLYRRSDPLTSKEGGERHRDKLPTRRRQVYDLVTDYPGRTGGELSRLMYARHSELPIRIAAETPHKRLHELEKLGYVRRGPPRECSDSGYNQHTWFAVDANEP